MIVQQAIFTSVRSGRNEGYQIAVNSSDMPSVLLRELSQWGPGHDSLYTELPKSESVNCHRLSSGLYCISLTALAGREYSGRGGQRVCTHMFLVPDEVLQRFGNNPFRVMESLVVSGRCAVQSVLPRVLDPFTLVGRASLVSTDNLKQVTEKLGAHKLASLVCAALANEKLGVSADISGKRLFSVLIDLLPPLLRPVFSFTTGLKATAARDYRLAILPNSVEEHRRAIRNVRLEVIDLASEPPAKYAPNSGWPQLVYRMLRSQQYAELARVIETTTNCAVQDIDVFAEQYRERLEKEADETAFTPFPA